MATLFWAVALWWVATERHYRARARSSRLTRGSRHDPPVASRVVGREPRARLASAGTRGSILPFG
jgi:hypothetical protein